MSARLHTNLTHFFSNRLRSDGLLIFISAIWGSGIVVQRTVAAEMGNYTFNGFRFVLATLLVLIVAKFRVRLKRSQLPWILLAGVLLFTASTFQQIGLKTTTASNAGFITGLYVVMIPLLITIFGRQRLNWITWGSVALAVIGTLLLSTGGAFKPAPGDWAELVGAFFWAIHVILVSKLAREMDNFQFAIGQFTIVSILNLVCAWIFEPHTLQYSNQLWWMVVYSGLFPIGLGFTLQIFAQKHAPPQDAAIIFSTEAVFSALFAAWLLNEKLLPLQTLGGLVILCSILLSQSRLFLEKKQSALASVETELE